MSTPFKPFKDTSRPFSKNIKVIIWEISVIIISFIFLMVTCYFRQNPTEILNIKFELFCLISGIVFVVLTVIQILIFKVIMSKKLAFLTIGSVACMLVTVISIAFFVQTVSTTNDRMGIVALYDTEDFKYVQNYRFGNFEMKNDIEATDVTIGYFYGTFNGNGYNVTGLETAEKGFVQKNKGTIENINFESPRLAQSIVVNNIGVIRNITVSSPAATFEDSEAFGTIVTKNTKTGIIDGCAVNNFIFDTEISKENLVKCDVFGSICAKNEGQISNCSVEKLSATAIASEFFGGISGRNGSEKLKATVLNCSVIDINANIISKRCCGGISGGGYANYIACETSGNVSITSENSASIGGITGELNLSGTIKGSENNIAFSTISAQVNIGGVVGTLYGNTVLEQSQNNGAIVSIISAANDDDYSYIGGIIGTVAEDNCLVKNVMNTGELKMDASNYDAGRNYNVFAIAGIYGGTDWRKKLNISNFVIENSCSVGNLTAIGNEVSNVGGLQSCCSGNFAEISNSFFAGKFTFIGCDEGWIVGQYNNNDYYTTDSGYDDKFSGYFEEADEISSAKLKDPNFIKNTLAWDEVCWNIKDGQMPTLVEFDIDSVEYVDNEIVPLESKEEIDPLEKQMDTLLIVFLIGMAIVIVVCVLLGRSGGSSTGSSNKKCAYCGEKLGLFGGYEESGRYYCGKCFDACKVVHDSVSIIDNSLDSSLIGVVKEDTIYTDWRTGERLKRTYDGKIVNSNGEEVGPGWWD